MPHPFVTFLERYGYLAVALLVAVEGMGIPISGGASVVAAGTFAAHDTLNIIGVILAASAGAVAGSTISYFIGRRGGRALLEKHGHRIRLDAQKLAKTESYYARHGVRTIFFGRYIAPVRVFGGLLAGVARMPFATFMVANVIGAVVWAATWSALGYAIGKNLSIMSEGLIEIAIAIAVFAIVWLFVRWLRKRKTGA
jgi:membrane protein DedA with SNARE-associated domain